MKDEEDLVERIENERKKLDDISLGDLSRPDVIKRQREFDKVVIEFLRKRVGAEPGPKDNGK